MLQRIRRVLPFFARYVFIGGIVFIIDINVFRAMLNVRWPLQALHSAFAVRQMATAISLLIAYVTHFNVNKYVTFRSFDRPASRQFATYLLVATTCWLITSLIIEVAVRLGYAPLTGKCVAVLVNIPIGFIGHKKLTFGNGLRSFLIRERRAA